MSVRTRLATNRRGDVLLDGSGGVSQFIGATFIAANNHEFILMVEFTCFNVKTIAGQSILPSRLHPDDCLPGPRTSNGPQDASPVLAVGPFVRLVLQIASQAEYRSRDRLGTLASDAAGP